MYPRTNYEMTEDDLKALLDACKPVPMMLIGGHAPSSAQANANRAWAALGKKMGFDSDSVRPIEGKGHRFFSAVPSETEEQSAVRVARETEEIRQRDIKELSNEIAWRQKRLDALTAVTSNERGEAHTNSTGGEKADG